MSCDPICSGHTVKKKKTHVCVVDKPTDKTKKIRRVNDGRNCEYEFILWSFLGELALGEEM